MALKKVATAIVICPIKAKLNEQPDMFPREQSLFTIQHFLSS